MALGRHIACFVGPLAAAVLLLGCGSGDSTNAEIDPVIAGEFTAKLGVIRQYAEDGKCDRSTQALATLKTAVDAESGQTGEQFTADLQEMLDRLNVQIQDQCQPPDQTTTTTTTDSTDTAPTTTDQTTTDPSTTTTTTTTTSTTNSTTTTPPPTTPGNGGGPPNNPGGGITPGGKKTRAAGGPPIDGPQHRGQGKPGKGGKHAEKKERGR
jgi:hypothetical protein